VNDQRAWFALGLLRRRQAHQGLRRWRRAVPDGKAPPLIVASTSIS
jgi:hypothetical protein